ncbi:MAG TPA: hypothetical protein DD990_36450, partial [Cyanobacteria bacterium UBA11368]|nr:hypothetical protein [Cyanobacteria bacterium UBA11368]
MLRVTIDMFSGRPNPSYLLDENEAKEVLKEIANNRAVVASTESGYQGLGYRGILVELLTDDTVEQYSLPTVFKIANGASLYESKGKEIAERLITGMSRATAVSSFMETPEVLEEDLQRQLLDHLGSLPRIEQQSEVDGSGAGIMEAEPAVTCKIELGAFNPGFWNAPAHVGKNNCYNYATNRRTDTFAQPGRATGKYPYPMNCAAVTAAALSDGAHKRFDCLPDSEKPRYLVAMVVAPGVDYHWYRKQKEGFWGHKPGGTPAKNTDNSGKII